MVFSNESSVHAIVKRRKKASLCYLSGKLTSLSTAIGQPLVTNHFSQCNHHEMLWPIFFLIEYPVSIANTSNEIKECCLVDFKV